MVSTANANGLKLCAESLHVKHLNKHQPKHDEDNVFIICTDTVISLR